MSGGSFFRNFFQGFFVQQPQASDKLPRTSSISLLHYPHGELKEDAVAVVRISAEGHDEFGTHAKEITYYEHEADPFYDMVGKCLQSGLSLTILTNKPVQSLGFELDENHKLTKVNKMDRLG
jgi:hypothetical protein